MDSNNKLRKVALASMTKIFAPMADAILRKTKHVEFLASQAEEHKELANRIRNCTDPAEAKTENFLDSFLDPQCGQAVPFQWLERTRISLSRSHFSQWNS